MITQYKVEMEQRLKEGIPLPLPLTALQVSEFLEMIEVNRQEREFLVSFL